MADVEQLKSQVNSGCSQYREAQAKVQRASSEMETFRNQADRAERESDRIDRELERIQDEIRSLQSQASSSDDGSSNSYAISRLSSLREQNRELMEQSDRVEQEMIQARANYQRAKSDHDKAQNELNSVRTYLVSTKSQLMQAGEVFKQKIGGFDSSIQILGRASGNMFGASATAQIGNLQASRNNYQTNLNTARSLIDQINSTVGLQGNISAASGGSSGGGFGGGFGVRRGGAGGYSPSGAGFVAGSVSRAGSNGSSGSSASRSSSGSSGAVSGTSGSSKSDYFAGIINDSQTVSDAAAPAPSAAGVSPFKPTGTTPRSLTRTNQKFHMNENNESIYDSPIETGRFLVDNQGSAYKSFQGTCGLCAIANILRLAGVNIGEKEIIDFASSGGFFSKLCNVDLSSPESSGGTTPEQRQAILEHFGVSSSFIMPEEGMNGRISESTIEEIGRAVSEGKGVIISVDAGEFYDDPRYNGCGHALTVTSVKYGPYREAEGFYIADSNGGTVYVEATKVRESLRPKPINVTNTIIR